MLCNSRVLITLFLQYICFFFINTATTEIYTLSLHDALPISAACQRELSGDRPVLGSFRCRRLHVEDRKSTRLNSSHRCISYAVFCLKKKRIGFCVEHLDNYRRSFVPS